MEISLPNMGAQVRICSAVNDDTSGSEVAFQSVMPMSEPWPGRPGHVVGRLIPNPSKRGAKSPRIGQHAMTEEDSAWQGIISVAREFRSLDYQQVVKTDNAHITADHLIYLTD